ncbi:MAG: UbiD family decarboxylase [Desulfobacterales bacterium]|nr:UbiD family decarboxylase [Desulfobacterales bacterium]
MIKSEGKNHHRDLRDWIDLLEEQGELKRITAEVDWKGELGAITRINTHKNGPALLFENIKDYRGTTFNRLFTNGLGARKRVALALGLPADTGDRTITTAMKSRYAKRLSAVKLDSGPVKENIITGKDIDLFQLPVPQWNHRDGGRYINTACSVVTMDPDTRIMNVGTYRGMLGGKNTIPVLLAASQHWGGHFAKHKRTNTEMPVAVVYGWDPTLLILSTAQLTHPGCSEYEIAGALREHPVELVKCETSDLWVPASAEIVVEGFISSDPDTFEPEGPFAEYVGYYGGLSSPKPVIRVECITHRNDPIFRGCCEGGTPEGMSEPYHWMTQSKCATAWNYLESLHIGEILGVWSGNLGRGTNLKVQIRKTHRGQAKQVAWSIWGSHLSLHYGKLVVVVDEDIDVFDDNVVDWAMAYRVNAGMGDVQIGHGGVGSMLDPSIPLEMRDIVKYGVGTWSPVLIDATVDWNLEEEEQYDGKRLPPLASDIREDMAALVEKKWKSYGL